MFVSKVWKKLTPLNKTLQKQILVAVVSKNRKMLTRVYKRPEDSFSDSAAADAEEDVHKDGEIEERKSCAKKKESLKLLLRMLEVSDNASDCHREVLSAMQDAGFDCDIEYPVEDRGDGHGGRIDIFASRSGLRYAIEIDRGTAREKSVFKLQHLPPDIVKIILLRGGDTDCMKDGIHYFSLRKRKVKRSVFVKPTIEEVKAYFVEKGFKSDPEHYYDYFESNGWRTSGGRGPMKDWKAAARNWERNDSKFKKRDYAGNTKPVYGNKAPEEFGKGYWSDDI